MSLLNSEEINFSPFNIGGISVLPEKLFPAKSVFQGDVFLGLDWRSAGFSSNSVDVGVTKARVSSSGLALKLGLKPSVGLGLGNFNTLGSILVSGEVVDDSLSFNVSAADSSVSINTPYAFASVSLDAGAAGSVEIDGTVRVPGIRWEKGPWGIPIPEPFIEDKKYGPKVSFDGFTSGKLFEIDSRIQQAFTFSNPPFNFTFTLPNFSGLSSTPQATPSGLASNKKWSSVDTEERVFGIGSRSKLFDAQLSLGQSLFYLGLPPTSFELNAGPFGLKGTLLDAVTEIGVDLDWTLSAGLRPQGFVEIEGISEKISLDKSDVIIGGGFADIDGDGLISGRVTIDPIIGVAINANLIPQVSASVKAVEAGLRILGINEGIGPLFNQGIGVDIANVNFADVAFSALLSDLAPGKVITQDFSFNMA